MNASIANLDAKAAFSARTGSANFVRMFQPRFAKLVKAGTKRQTIRPIPKRMPKQGDTVSLRMWTGKPYRSKQRILRTSRINYVADVKITRNTLVIAGWYRCTKPNQAGHRDEQARLDGFRDWNEMRDWFEATHGLPFRGVMIHWLNAELSGGGPMSNKTTEAESRRSLDRLVRHYGQTNRSQNHARRTPRGSQLPQARSGTGIRNRGRGCPRNLQRLRGRKSRQGMVRPSAIVLMSND